MKKISTLIVIAFVNVFSNAHAMDEIRLLQNDELKKTNYIKIHVWDSTPEIPGHASLEIIGFKPDSQNSIDYISVKKGGIYHKYSEDLEHLNNKTPTTFILHCINGENIRKYYKTNKESLFNSDKNNGFYVPLHLLKKACALEELFPNRTFWDLLSAESKPVLGVAAGVGLCLHGDFYAGISTGGAALCYGGYQLGNYLFGEKDTDLYESNVTHNQLKSLLTKACKFQQEKYFNIAHWFPNGSPTAEEADALADLERRMLQLEQNSMKTISTPQQP